MYIELFLLDNIIMNAIILKLAALICSKSIRFLRLILASLFGAVYAYLSLWFPLLMMLPFKLVSMIALSFAINTKERNERIRACIALFVSSMAVGGAALLVAEVLGGGYYDGAVIASEPMRFVLLSIIAALVLLRLFKRLKVMKRAPKMCLEIKHGEKTLMLEAMLDSGNGVYDPVTLLPVIIIYMKEMENEANIPVPVVSANEKSIMYAFKPDEIKLDGESVDALVGISKLPIKGCDALVPYQL